MNTEIASDRIKATSGGLIAKIAEHIEELAIATDTARVSDEMLRYLDACSKFHQYSLFNLWLILMAKPNATVVAGFRKWQSLNRYVRRGEHGIPILAPIVVTCERDGSDSEKALAGFKVVYVFDISQTEGEPLPPPPDWKSPEKYAELAERLIRFAQERRIVVSEKKLTRDVQGVSKGGSIEIDPSAGTLTIIHEIAHELMHRGPERPVAVCIREMEAEAVAYVVARHFGLTGQGSPNYVALHGADSKIVLDRMERIRRIATEIIDALEQSPSQ